MQFEWKGVFPAITTQFNDGDEIDYPVFEKNLEAQIRAGIDGVILGGTLGESSVLTKVEKESLLRFTLDKVAKRIPVVLNIAEGSTRDAVEEAILAEKDGAVGLMLQTPMRYKSDHLETVNFFKEVAKATGLPIMIYNNPVDYKTLVTLDMFDELQNCKNITAVKESTRQVSNVTRMLNRFGDRFKILCGVDTIAMECLLMGAHGWVAGLVDAFPAETVAIYRYAKSGRIADALKIHRWFLPLLELDLQPKLVQYIKLAASQTGIGAENVRSPRLMLDGKEREEILTLVKDKIKTRPDLGDYLNIKL